MKSGKTIRGMASSPLAALTALLLAAAPAPWAQAQAAHYLGTVTAISGDTLTVKTDAGQVNQVQVPSTAQLKRIEPGQTDLSKAETMDFGGLATGDRVLVTLSPNSDGATPQALRIIAIKEADVARKQQAETAAWNQGVHGLVKSVDAAAGVVVVNMRQGLQTREVTVNIGESTVLKRYAPGSVRFDQAQPAPMSAIHSGDQLWARGTKNAEGTAIAADAVVSGSFRSIAGTVLSTDTSASTVTVKDLATKKPVTIHISADAQLRRLDSAVATVIAARVKGTQAGSANHTANTGSGNGSGGTQRPSSQSGAGGAGFGDLESILERAPAIPLGSLQKGEAVMIVATEDASGVNAIKLLAGVEPLLEAPEAQDLLSSWSLNQGESEAATE
ncbi:MAG: hypothetical protein ABSC62_01280 [Terracidiphilus sp.]|jgi:hypothetical protein